MQLAILFTASPSFAKTCPKGQYWVGPHFRSEYVRYDGVKVRATEVRGHCRANPRGYEKWHRGLSNERPKVWGYKGEVSKKWTSEEAERVYDAIAILPQQLLDLSNVKVHRMAESVTKGNPATSNLNDVVLYDLAFKHKASLEQILAHELSHALYYTLNEELIESFAHTAGWEQHLNRSGFWIPKEKKKFIEEDSRFSLEEDFANHIEHYLFKSGSLKKNSPKSHEWIYKTFGKDFKIQEKK